MKKRFVFPVSILLCSLLAVARVGHYNVRQLYAGEARPRAEVVWIWLDPGVYITDVDGSPVAAPRAPASKSEIRLCANPNQLYLAEVLPGNHEIWVAYRNPPDYSKFKLPLKVDAKAGENYEVQPNFKVRFKGGDNWNPVIVPFSPDAEHFQARPECRF